MTRLRSKVLASIAFALALLADCAFASTDTTAVALAATPCPRHVQSVLLSRQYDDCLAHLGAQETTDTTFAFTAANAHALHTSVACSRALMELLAVTPEAPCTAQLSGNGERRVLMEAQQLHWIANHPSSNQAAITRHLASGGSTLYHVRYSCHFETKQPFNADSDMTEDFTVLCRENMLVEYPSFWTWFGYIVLGLVGLVLVVVLCVYAASVVERLRRRSDHSSDRMAAFT